MENENLKDLKKLEVTEIELKKGKKAIVGGLTFDVIIWVEEKYGDVDKFIRIFQGIQENKIPPIKDLIEILYQILENKDDFKDYRDFARYVDIRMGIDIFNLILESINHSIPTLGLSNATNKGAIEEKKEQAG